MQTLRVRCAEKAQKLALTACVASAAFLSPAAAAQISKPSELASDGQDIVIVSGELEAGDDERFELLTRDSTEVQVVLNSPGGNLMAGIGIGRIVRSRGYRTAVLNGSVCASACALAWLGGQNRFLGKTGRVGFHAASSPNEATSPSSAGNAVMGAYLGELGLSTRAIVYISSAPPQGVTWLSLDAARELGIRVRVPVATQAPAAQRTPPAGSASSEQAMPAGSPPQPQAAHPPPTASPARTAQVPNDYIGDWTSKRGDCQQDMPNGVEVLSISERSIGWWEIGCEILSSRSMGDALRLTVNCIKGGGIAGAGTIELRLRPLAELVLSTKDLGFQSPGSSSYYSCAADRPQDEMWIHNGSLMTVKELGNNLEIRYASPRPGIAEVGVRPGDLLFSGRIISSHVEGTAFIFSKRCGPLSYRVSGTGSVLKGEILLEGEAPIPSPTCTDLHKSKIDMLRFSRRS